MNRRCVRRSTVRGRPRIAATRTPSGTSSTGSFRRTAPVDCTPARSDRHRCSSRRPSPHSWSLDPIRTAVPRTPTGRSAPAVRTGPASTSSRSSRYRTTRESHRLRMAASRSRCRRSARTDSSDGSVRRSEIRLGRRHICTTEVPHRRRTARPVPPRPLVHRRRRPSSGAEPVHIPPTTHSCTTRRTRRATTRASSSPCSR
ncbi:MAG: hypothetical protein JWM10_2453 [Myxococcaceae bacterium]|nr:hypothetical protein [Myxococcaceae bacterium]